MNYPDDWRTGGEVTILVTDKLVTKTMHSDGTWEPYPNVYRWTVRQVGVSGLQGLSEEILRVSSYGKACIVRGEPLGAYSEPVRRLIHPCHKTGDQPTFTSAPVGLHWVCIDVDGVPTTHDPRTDPAGYANDARKVLPRELTEGRCFYQLSASAGIKEGARVHLWYWLEYRATDDALRFWADSVEHIDASLFSAVQPHYVVPPRFVGGVDPIPCRTGFLDGTESVWPADLMGVEKWQAFQDWQAFQAKKRRENPVYQARSERRGDGAIASSIAEIESAGPGARNAAICRRANFLGRVVSTGSISIEDARSALEDAARNALGNEWASRANTTINAIEHCLQSGIAAGDDNG